MQTIPKLKSSALDLMTPLLGVIWSLVRWDLPRYLYTKFEVSSFIRSKFTKGGLKFKNSTMDPDHAPLSKVLCHS